MTTSSGPKLLQRAKALVLCIYIWKSLLLWYASSRNQLSSAGLTIIQSDIGDPLRHFSNEASQRALSCPTLLKSFLTTAAMTMISSPKYKSHDGRHHYKGLALPKFNHETVLKHHNACVTDLISLCDDRSCVQDENVLAALVCLRHYEERDAFYTGEDGERLLPMLRLFLETQTRSRCQAYTREKTHLKGNQCRKS